MNKLVILLSFITFAHGLIKVPAYDLSYRSGHLTPRGYDHPDVSVNGWLSYETEGLDPSVYIGTILMMPFRPNWDIDVCKYQELGVTCVIVTGTTLYVPGFIIVKGYNNCTYTCAMDLNYPDFAELATLLGNVSAASNYTTSIYVEIDNSDGNEWKEMSNSAIFYIMQILGGIVSIYAISFNINDILLATGCKTTTKGSSEKINFDWRHLRNQLFIASLLLIAGILGLPGFLDFTCFRQIMPHRACNVLTSSRISFIFGACWFLIFVMMELGTVTTEINYGIMKRFWGYIIIVVILIVMDNLCATLLTYMQTAEETIALITIWLACILGLTLACAVLLTIVSVRTLRRLNTSVSLSPDSRKGQLAAIAKRLMIILSVISLSLFGYVLNAGLVNYTINYPYSLAGSFLTYTTLLNVIVIALTYNNHVSIRNRLSGLMKSSTSGKAGSNETGSSGLHGTTTDGIDMSNITVSN